MSRQPNQNSINVCVVNERQPTFLSIQDAARDLACSPGHVRNLIAAGKVRSVKIDGLIRFRLEDWDAYTATAQPVTPKSKNGETIAQTHERAVGSGANDRRPKLCSSKASILQTP